MGEKFLSHHLVSFIVERMCQPDYIVRLFCRVTMIFIHL